MPSALSRWFLARPPRDLPEDRSATSDERDTRWITWHGLGWFVGFCLFFCRFALPNNSGQIPVASHAVAHRRYAPPEGSDPFDLPVTTELKMKDPRILCHPEHGEVRDLKESAAYLAISQRQFQRLAARWCVRRSLDDLTR